MVVIEKEMERTGGIAPSVREIADHFHYHSTSPTRSLLAGLEARRHIHRIAGRDRAIEVAACGPRGLLQIRRPRKGTADVWPVAQAINLSDPAIGAASRPCD
jgi:SOS-response transcriptional repressor LexA